MEIFENFVRVSPAFSTVHVDRGKTRKKEKLPRRHNDLDDHGHFTATVVSVALVPSTLHAHTLLARYQQHDNDTVRA